MLPSGGEATAHAGRRGEALRDRRIFRNSSGEKAIGIYIAFIVFYRFAEGLVIKDRSAVSQRPSTIRVSA